MLPHSTIASLRRLSLLGTAACVILCMSALVVKADRAKRTGLPKGGSVSSTSVLRYSTPLYGALEATFLALNQTGTKKSAPAASAPSSTVQQAPKATLRDADTSRRDNKIVFARATADQFAAKIELVDEQAVIDVGIYNMLGKKVIDVYRGGASRGPHDYTVGVSDLPEGVYI
ncbi:MAG: T9SS type A sorting domain-containing protein [Candidatus Kapabacteria bacterium]|nr:T9SS type A sorting domain-containing protein [Candidatus Kapabacteria bacterium]